MRHGNHIRHSTTARQHDSYLWFRHVCKSISHFKLIKPTLHVPYLPFFALFTSAQTSTKFLFLQNLHPHFVPTNYLGHASCWIVLNEMGNVNFTTIRCNYDYHRLMYRSCTDILPSMCIKKHRVTSFVTSTVLDTRLHGNVLYVGR